MAGWFVLALLLWQVFEMAAAPDRPDTADASAIALSLAVAMTIGLALVAPGGGHAFGLGFIALGAALRVWAIRTLGPLFLDGVCLRPIHPRSQSGPYRWLQHPAAIGTLTLTAGVVVGTGSWVAAVSWVGLLLPLTWFRTRAENRLLDLPTDRGHSTV